MVQAFVIVVIAVGVVGVLGALAALFGGRRTWEQYGRDHLLLDSDRDEPGHRRSAVVVGPRPSAAATPAARAAREAEIRQMVEAANARRRRRGEPERDVDSELERLGRADAARSAPPVDAALREEVRDLVIARNHRRVRRGQAPLDVQAEIDRELGRLNG